MQWHPFPLNNNISFFFLFSFQRFLLLIIQSNNFNESRETKGLPTLMWTFQVQSLCTWVRRAHKLESAGASNYIIEKIFYEFISWYKNVNKTRRARGSRNAILCLRTKYCTRNVIDNMSSVFSYEIIVILYTLYSRYNNAIL